MKLPLFKERLRQMKNISYELLGKESSRLLRQQKSLLKKSLNTPNLFDKNRNTKQESYNFTEVEESINEIDNELHKLETMETIIAVVGTMKAGKSTTINAIVGKEILPNRNDPMTTLPTLIRNKHNQVDPILTLAKTSTLIKLSKQVAKNLNDKKRKGELTDISPVMYGTSDGKELIEMLIKNQSYDFRTTYSGQNEIFHFLKHLNDIMRLAKELHISVDDVYESYQESKDLPLIEVEFCHLQAMEKSANGNLSILDTPGPNEVGQSQALKTVFLRQLKRATSIMLVIDYTQMRSEAESDVREQIDSIRHELDNERLSILVNKFDQSNSNSMNKEVVKSYVANSLMSDASLESRVFPISSWEAYLANRTLNYLELNDVMPAIVENEQSWVSDFGASALGKRWQKKIMDTEEVKESAEALWEESFFQEPLNNVIKDSHSNAARLCVTAAIAKLSRIHEIFNNTINIRSTILNKEINQISEAIATIEENIKGISTLAGDVKQTANKGISSFSSNLEMTLDSMNDVLKKEVHIFLEQGNKAATEELKVKGELKVNSIKSDFRSNLAFIFTGGAVDHSKTRKDKVKKKYEYKVTKDVVTFVSESEAKFYLRKVNSVLEGLIASGRTLLEKEFIGNIKHLSEAIDNQINQQAKAMLQTAKNKLEGHGFDLTLTPPVIATISHEILLDNVINRAYQEDTTSKEVTTRRNTVWGGICSFFGTDDWGWDSHTEESTKYSINVGEIHKNIQQELDQSNKHYQLYFTDYLQKTYEPTIDSYLAELVGYLDSYKGILIDGEKLKQELEANKAENLRLSLKELSKQGAVQAKDLGVIKNSLKESKSANNE